MADVPLAKTPLPLAELAGADTATDGQVPTSDGAGAVAWETPAGGGGSLSHAYAGKTTDGASRTALTANRYYVKQVTLASDALISSVGVNLDGGGGQEINFVVGIWSDNAGAPHRLIALNGYSPGSNLVFLHATGIARWIHAAVGLWCPAGPYWIGFGPGADPGTMTLGYDASVGSDKHFTSAGSYMRDAAGLTITSVTDSYDIRASVLS